ncbi:hypothetical protein ACJMK2_037232 [Sinanodonta woodiana]|uniref:Uncharacterized protein n=1 Tax=Sinanodonta woodiana TaxID=1069815 RepID=A0ABD3WL12_SINWO
MLLHILQNYDIALMKINLAENDISSTVLEAIRRLLRECDSESHSTSSISTEQPSLAQSEPPLVYSEIESRSMISLKSPETLSARLGDIEVENIENDEKIKITEESNITTMTDEDVLFLARALESQDKKKYFPESLVEGKGTNSLQTSEKSSEFRVDLEDDSVDTNWEELQTVKSTGRLLMVQQSASTVSGVEDIKDMTEELASIQSEDLASIQSADMGENETISIHHPSTTQSFNSLRNSHLSLM